MGDSASGQRGGGAPRRGRQTSPGSSVLTPPTGLPAVSVSAVPDLDDTIPAQRTPNDLRAAPKPPVVVEPCACGHARVTHDHYRSGSDCGACGAAGCAEFRAEGGAFRRAMRRFGLVA